MTNGAQTPLHAEGVQGFCSLIISFVSLPLHPDITATLASLFQGM